MELTKKALLIATKAHEGQLDKAGQPYINHPMAVAAAVETELEKTVALLHDVVEDSEITLDDLRAEGFPDEVIDALRLLTKPAGADYFLYIGAIKQNPLAKAIKLADLAHNMDLSRLPEVTPKDKERARKYAWARDYLLDKPFSDPRWHDNPFGKVTGYQEHTSEEREQSKKEFRQLLIEQGVVTEEDFKKADAESAAADPFYSPANMTELQKAVEDADAGKLTAHELIEE